MNEESVRAEDEALLRERAVEALLVIGRLYGAGQAYLTEAAPRGLVSKALAELVEYLSVRFVVKPAPNKQVGTQDSVILKVKNIEEATANAIAGWLDGHAASWRQAAMEVVRMYPNTPGVDGPQRMMALSAEATAKQVREGAWRSQKKGG